MTNKVFYGNESNIETVDKIMVLMQEIAVIESRFEDHDTGHLRTAVSVLKDRVNELVLPNSHLYLWVTNNFLVDGLKVMDAWGFKYITTITWLKDRIGLGQYYRGITEHCLFGRKGGALPYRTKDGKRQQGKTIIQEPKTIHSRKPIKMYEYIEKVSHPPYLELFARKERKGWDTWGIDVDGQNFYEFDLNYDINRDYDL